MSLTKLVLGIGLGLVSGVVAAQTINSQAQWEQSPATDHLELQGLLTTSASFRSDKPILIKQTLDLEVQPGTTLHLGGPIGNTLGMGVGIRKWGTGTLVLSGTNSYGGVTRLLQGTLQVAGSQAVGGVSTDLQTYAGTTLVYEPDIAIQRNVSFLAVQGDVAQPAVGPYAHGLQWRVNSGVATQHGFLNLAPGSSVYKQGAGVLRIAGNSMGFSSNFIVEQGGLLVDGEFTGHVQVQDGSWLRGNGLVGSAVISQGGVLWASTGPKGLTFTDTLVFEPDSQFVVNVAAAGHGAPVLVQRHATLAGQVQVRTEDVAASLWPASWEYPVLRALDGFGDTAFDEVTVNVPFLTAGLRYDANTVYLQLGLDQQAQDAWPFSGGWAASLLSGLTEDSRFVRQAALRHATQRYTALQPAARSHTGPFLWADAFYSNAERGAQGGVPGDQRDLTGIVVGVQQSLGDTWRVNAFVGMQHGQARRRNEAMDLSQTGGLPLQASASARVNSVHAGLSAAWQRDGVGVAVGAAHTWHSIRSTRSLAWGGLRDAPRARYDGRTAQVFGEVSLDGLQSATTRVTPFARVAWVQTRTPGYTEQGGPAALRFEASRQNVGFATLGIRADHTVDTTVGQATVHGTLAWRHAAGNITPVTRHALAGSAHEGGFTSNGLPISRHALVLQAGVTAALADGVDLRIAYAGQYGRGYQDHGAQLVVSRVF